MIHLQTYILTGSPASHHRLHTDDNVCQRGFIAAAFTGQFQASWWIINKINNNNNNNDEAAAEEQQSEAEE